MKDPVLLAMGVIALLIGVSELKSLNSGKRIIVPKYPGFLARLPLIPTDPMIVRRNFYLRAALFIVIGVIATLFWVAVVSLNIH